MPCGNHFTVNEHFIPQTYLRGFSSDQKRVYRLDLKSGLAQDFPLPINSIAYKKNLYEMKDSEGEFISRNYVENQFSKLEDAFTKHKNHLITRIVETDRNHNVVPDFLTEKDRIFWTLIAALQILRNPKILKTANILLRNLIGCDLSQEAVHADILGASFPFFCDSGIENTQLLTLMLKCFYPMKLFAGVTHGNQLITSDNPVFCCPSSDGSLTFREVYFPITSNIVLFFINQAALPPDKGNALFAMNDSIVNRVNDNIVFSAYNEVFSYHPFSDELKAKILEVEHSPIKQQFIQQRNIFINSGTQFANDQ